MAVTIKAFGKDSTHDCLESLKAKIASSHKGKHISLVEDKSSGIKSPIFISVCKSGTSATLTYQPEVDFDFNQLTFINQ